MENSKEAFTKKLLMFFDRHDPSNKRKVPEIVSKFHGHEDEVFEHLTQRYADVEGDEHTKKVSSGEGISVPSGANSGDDLI